MFFVFAVLSTSAQTNSLELDGRAQPTPTATNEGLTTALRFQKVRMDCIRARRIICGKVIKVLPDGLVVESGYTNLMRAPINKSWLIPGNVVASRPTDLVEANEPDAVCVGFVFLVDLPKSHGKPKKPKLYDYVNLEAFPVGTHTYTSVGAVQHTVRRFTTKLSNATLWNFRQTEPQNASPK
jgi:hypothetical protein